MIGIVVKNFLQAKAKGTLPNNRVTETKMLKINSRKVEEAFGFKFLSYKE